MLEAVRQYVAAPGWFTTHQFLVSHSNAAIPGAQRIIHRNVEKRRRFGKPAQFSALQAT
jgi:hypothetical protein